MVKIKMLKIMLHFIPTPAERKEQRKLQKQNFVKEFSEQQEKMKKKMNNGVTIVAFDPLAIRVRKFTSANRVIISTDIPLSREVWLEVYTLLKKRRDEAIQNKEPPLKVAEVPV